MNWTGLILKGTIDTDLPYESLITSIKGKSYNKGSSFRLSEGDNHKTRILYAYRQGLNERLGYYGGPLNEIVIVDNGTDNKVNIKFQYPNSVLIGFGLIIIGILMAGLYIVPEFGLLGTSILLLTVYLGLVVRFYSQLYYFKSDLEEIEDTYMGQFRQ